MNEVKIGKIIKYISTNLEKKANNLLKEQDLSLSQGLVLIWLSEAEGEELPIKKIERKFGTAQSTTYGIVNRLVNKGYVECHSINSKTKIVKLCKEGAEKVNFIRACVQSSEVEMFAGFTQGERAIFTEFLLRAEKNLNNSAVLKGDGNNE